MTLIFEIHLCALAVWGEARGEEYRGKLAVAWVIRNRCKFQKAGVSHVVLKAYQISFFNTTDPSRDDISDIDEKNPVWRECIRAACGALLELSIDPTYGAEFYYNPHVVPRPDWWNNTVDPNSEVTIGNHLFGRRK